MLSWRGKQDWVRCFMREVRNWVLEKPSLQNKTKSEINVWRSIFGQGCTSVQKWFSVLWLLPCIWSQDMLSTSGLFGFSFCASFWFADFWGGGGRGCKQTKLVDLLKQWNKPLASTPKELDCWMCFGKERQPRTVPCQNECSEHNCLIGEGGTLCVYVGGGGIGLKESCMNSKLQPCNLRTPSFTQTIAAHFTFTGEILEIDTQEMNTPNFKVNFWFKKVHEWLRYEVARKWSNETVL